MANVVFVVFDITKKESFDNVNLWLKNVEGKCKKNILKILVGNKLDLKEERQVGENEANIFAKSLGMPYFETSAKDNKNVNELFERTAEEFLCRNDLVKNIFNNTIEIGNTPEEQSCCNFGCCK